MENPGNDSQNNSDVQGYKVPGDGNAPNEQGEPRNRSFEENSQHMHKSQDDVPGKEFNIGDKAFFDSSKADFVETVSKHHHADETAKKPGFDIDLSYKKPDGDR